MSNKNSKNNLIIVSTKENGSGKTVAYHNDMNKLSTRNWNIAERHLFTAIIVKLRDQGTKEVVMDKDDLRELSDYSDRHKARFKDTMANLINKVDDLELIQYTEKNGWNTMQKIRMFDEFIAEWANDRSDIKLKIRISPHYSYFVNALSGNFTQFELSEYLSLKSTYSAACYMQLKQWRTVGRRTFEVDEFKQLLDIPKSYRNYDIKRRVLTPIRNELSQFFKDLKIVGIKSGRKIVKYDFTWTPETKANKKTLKPSEVTVSKSIRSIFKNA